MKQKIATFWTNVNWRTEIKNFLLVIVGTLMLIISIDSFLAPSYPLAQPPPQSSPKRGGK